jgi:hypothetical protein
MDVIALKIKDAINQLLKTHTQLIVAIDGRCAAGKTTLATQLQRDTGCNVIHMDHFFLRPEQRAPRRLQQPGGNVDWERVKTEVLQPLKRGTDFCYRPYDCHTQTYKEPIQVQPGQVTIIEGSYSCHPELFDFYDFHIFLTISPEVQRRRILYRNGAAGLKTFQDKWIVLEERYFEAFSIKKRCELCFDTNGLTAN